MRKILLLYIPVIHQGYLDLFKKYQGEVDTLWIIDSATAFEYMPVKREIRALNSVFAYDVLKKTGMFQKVTCITEDLFNVQGPISIVTTDELVTRQFIEVIKSKIEISAITYDRTFLHWDENSIHAPTNVRYDRISSDPFDREMMKLAKIEGERSSDWWRHVGVVLVKDGKSLFETHNTHLPSEYSPYIFGDPRDFVKSGTSPEICGAIHAEKLIICLAAKNGISIDGCDIYLTTFPCIPCAQAVACAGIKRVFYGSGNAYLNTDEVLKSRGVEIILVQ